MQVNWILFLFTERRKKKSKTRNERKANKIKSHWTRQIPPYKCYFITETCARIAAIFRYCECNHSQINSIHKETIRNQWFSSRYFILFFVFRLFLHFIFGKCIKRIDDFKSDSFEHNTVNCKNTFLFLFSIVEDIEFLALLPNEIPTSSWDSGWKQNKNEIKKAKMIMKTIALYASTILNIVGNTLHRTWKTIP